MSAVHQEILVAIAGQPNCGKSTVFNMLTGSRQHVANFPGVTVEKKQGRFTVEKNRVEAVDLPGTYSLSSFSHEERVTRDFMLLEKPEVVVAVVDASNIERHLQLVFQLREMQVPMILCLNMIDVAIRRGFTIDTARLSERLGMPVVQTIATRGQGREELRETIVRVANEANHEPARWNVDYGPETEPVLEKIGELISQREHLIEDFPARWLAIKILEGDSEARRIMLHHTHDGRGLELVESIEKIKDGFVREFGQASEKLIVQGRADLAARITRDCVKQEKSQPRTSSDRADAILCHRWLGLAFVALCMFLTFEFTFQLADGLAWVPWSADFTEWTTPVGVFGWFFKEVLPPLADSIPDGPLHSLVRDGIIGGVGGVMVFVPIIFFMFIFLSIIEDSGYIARIAFVLDRALRFFGLQGQSVLAMVVSGGIAGGCAVPGIMATRTMRDREDRLITMMVAPFMSCGAKIPVYGLLVGAFFAAYEGLMMWMIMLISWALALLAALVLRKAVIQIPQMPFMMEMPAYHMPTVFGVLHNAMRRSWLYMKKAGTIILAINILLWAMMYFPRQDTAPFDGQREAAIETAYVSLGNNPYAVLLSPPQFEDTVNLADSADDEKLGFEVTLQQKQFIEALAAYGGDPGTVDAMSTNLKDAILAFDDCRQKLIEIDNAQKQHQRANSIAGVMGRALEPLSRLCGFTWRDNIALIGGFAAKEVIISTLSISYSMGDADPGEVEEMGHKHPLSRQLENDPSWTPLKAFALIIFIMVYAPCFATIAVIWRESGSWKWALFSTAYTTTLGYVLAVLIYQIGGALGG